MLKPFNLRKLYSIASREGIRFFRSSKPLAVCSVVVIGLGLGASAFALALLLTFSDITYPGIRIPARATLAAETAGGASVPVTFDRFEQFRTAISDVAQVAAYSRSVESYTQSDSPRILAVAVSRGFFSHFTEPLAAGRDFDVVEEQTGGQHVAILAYKFAERLFGSASNALDRVILIKDTSFRCVGIAPRSFEGLFGDNVNVWVPSSAAIPLIVAPQKVTPTAWKSLNAFYTLTGSNRLNSSSLLGSLKARLQGLDSSDTVLRIAPGLTNDPSRDDMLRKRLRLGLALAMTFVVVTCMNVAFILLSRVPKQARDIQLKKALGADRDVIVLELLIGPAAIVTFGLLVSGILLSSGVLWIAGVSGFYGQVGHAAWQNATYSFIAQCPFALFLTILITLLPLIGMLRQEAMLHVGNGNTFTPRSTLLMQVPVILQTSLTTTTWIMTGMIVSSLLTEMRQPLGYEPNHLTVVNLRPTSSQVTISWRNDSPPAQVFALATILRELRFAPGVRSAAYTSSPVFQRDFGDPRTIEINDSDAHGRWTVQDTVIGPGYFRTIGAKLLSGREFAEMSGAQEIIVNKTAAREMWPHLNPIGRSIQLLPPAAVVGQGTRQKAFVVGVVEDIRAPGYGHTVPPAIYTSMYQNGVFDITPHIVVRSTESRSVFESRLRPQIALRLRGWMLASAYDVQDEVDKAFVSETRRTYAALGVALVMAVVCWIGLYAALTHYVVGRRRELAIRMCLGAPPHLLRRQVFRFAFQCTGGAILLTTPFWPLLARLASTEYLGSVAWSTERAVFICICCLLVSGVIAIVPSNKAASISPANMLKEE